MGDSPLGETPDQIVSEVRQLTLNGQLHEALQLLDKALGTDPDSIPLLVQLAKSMNKAAMYEDAEMVIRKAILLDPSVAEAHVLLGYRLQELGRFDEAIESFQRAIEIEPGKAAAYYGLVTTKKVTDADRPLLDQMATRAKTKGLPPHDRRDFHYALGKAHNDLEEYEQAMCEFEEAHSIAAANLPAGNRPFDPDAYEAHVDRMIKVFTCEFFERHLSMGSDSEVPILFVGMPRSGSTLFEQVISSHPKVGAGGELQFWLLNGLKIFKGVATGMPDQVEIQATGKDYLLTLSNLAPDKARVTDKMPNNFLYLGVIHLAFPKAQIIHCRRHPVDNCLSLYMSPSRNPGPMVQNRDTILFAYRHYMRLMDHWRNTLPASVFLEVDYESLVEKPEQTTRELIKSCGLPWDDACLHPERNDRVVSTPSLWQVRQPVYKTALRRWRHYEPWLGPFRELLTEVELKSVSKRNPRDN